jgi:hypothetical protein
MRLLKQFAIVTASGLASLAMASGAWAYFTAAGTAEGAARVGTVNPPTAVTALQAAPAVGTVHVQWTAPTAPGGFPLSGYYVERLGTTPIPACASSPASLLATGASDCDDTGVTPGTYTYRVTAVYRSLSATSAPAPVTVDVAAPAE